MSGGLKDTLRSDRKTAIVLAVAAVIFIVLLAWARNGREAAVKGDEYVEYEKASVTAVLSDNVSEDESSDGAFRGEQMLTAIVKTGQYKGEELLVNNYVGPLYGVPVSEGDSVTLVISTHKSGEHNATVYEYNRIPVMIGVILLFFITVILVGGKKGLKSLAGLIFTVICLFMILIPLLIKGAPTIPAVFLMCAYISLVSFVILGGVSRKTIAAYTGTVLGTLFAAVFGVAAEGLAKINGLRIPDVEPLLQLRQTGTPIGLKGLLVAGIIISALGAVMDVSMSISSALEEVRAADPALTSKQLFRSGMNIGQDMVGTMTNTLILAFLGSGFTLIIYLYSLGLGFYQLGSSAYIAIEVISGISSSIGMVLTIPLTALVSSRIISVK